MGTPLLALLLPSLSQAAELQVGEVEGTAYTLGARTLAQHPLDEPWRLGLLPMLDATFSVQSALTPGPSLGAELAPLQGRHGALSLEVEGRYAWTAGFDAAVAVADERIAQVTDLSKGEEATVADELAAGRLLSAQVTLRGSVVRSRVCA